VKNLKKQRNCKICQSEEWIAKAILSLHQCEKLGYREIIERMLPHIELNEYNISVHLHRHCEQKDIIEAEESQARFEKYKAKCLAES
jgi:hypothetical protein